MPAIGVNCSPFPRGTMKAFKVKLYVNVLVVKKADRSGVLFSMPHSTF